MEINELDISIQNLLYTQLNGIYCDTCRFMNISESESEKLFGYYGCEGCIRKSMNWEISEETCRGLTSKILEIVTNDLICNTDEI